MFYITFVGFVADATSQNFNVQKQLGATIVGADDADSAMEKAHRMKLIPDVEGVCAVVVLLEEEKETHPFTISMLNRFVGMDEVMKMGAVQVDTIKLIDNVPNAAYVTLKNVDD